MERNPLITKMLAELDAMTDAEKASVAEELLEEIAKINGHLRHELEHLADALESLVADVANLGSGSVKLRSAYIHAKHLVAKIRGSD